MTKPWVPPRPTYHLRIFLVCLVILFASLAGVLFGVHLNATVHGTGRFEVRGRTVVAAPSTGVVNLGWFETSFIDENGIAHPVRLDESGNGHVSRGGRLQTVIGYEGPTGMTPQTSKPAFHRLRKGDIVWPGQVIGSLTREPLAAEMKALRSLLAKNPDEISKNADVLKRLDNMESRWLKPITLNAPNHGDMCVASTVPGENPFVNGGDTVAVFTPNERNTDDSHLVAVLAVPETQAGAVAKGQIAVLSCATHNDRVDGKVEACIEKLDFAIRKTPDGKRTLRVWAGITHAPFALRSGTSFEAKIILGRKPVYRIILER